MTHPAWKMPPANHANTQRYKALALLRERGHLTTEQLRDATGWPMADCATHLYVLTERGYCWSVRVTYRHSIYFSTPEAAERYDGRRWEPSQVKPRPNRPRPVPAAEGEVIVPEGVQVQVGPAYTHDSRFQFAPGTTRLPEGMQGAGFVAEWNRLRRSRVSPKEAT